MYGFSYAGRQPPRIPDPPARHLAQLSSSSAYRPIRPSSDLAKDQTVANAPSATGSSTTHPGDRDQDREDLLGWSLGPNSRPATFTAPNNGNDSSKQSQENIQPGLQPSTSTDYAPNPLWNINPNEVPAKRAHGYAESDDDQADDIPDDNAKDSDFVLESDEEEPDRMTASREGGRSRRRSTSQARPRRSASSRRSGGSSLVSRQEPEQVKARQKKGKFVDNYLNIQHPFLKCKRCTIGSRCCLGGDKDTNTPCSLCADSKTECIWDLDDCLTVWPLQTRTAFPLPATKPMKTKHSSTQRFHYKYDETYWDRNPELLAQLTRKSAPPLKLESPYRDEQVPGTTAAAAIVVPATPIAETAIKATPALKRKHNTSVAESGSTGSSDEPLLQKRVRFLLHSEAGPAVPSPLHPYLSKKPELPARETDQIPAQTHRAERRLSSTSREVPRSGKPKMLPARRSLPQEPASSHIRDNTRAASRPPVLTSSVTRVDDWEKQPICLPEDVTRIQDRVAFSSGFVSKEGAAPLAPGFAFSYEVLRPWQKLVLAVDETAVRGCSLAVGRVRVRVGDLDFDLNPHSVFKIRPGQACEVQNTTADEAEVHIYSHDM